MFMHKTHACMYMQPNLRTHHLDWHVFLRDGHQVGVQMLRSIFVFHSLFLRREWWVLELLSYQVGLDRVHYIANQDSPNRGGSSPIFAREHVDGCREEPCNTCWLFGALGELMHVHASIYISCAWKKHFELACFYIFDYSPKAPQGQSLPRPRSYQPSCARWCHRWWHRTLILCHCTSKPWAQRIFNQIQVYDQVRDISSIGQFILSACEPCMAYYIIPWSSIEYIWILVSFFKDHAWI